MRPIRPTAVVCSLAFAVVLSGCEKQPASIKVKGPRDAVESVKMEPVFAPFEKKGDTMKLRASAFGEDGAFMGPAKVKWSTSDSTAASVSQDGLVTILSSGKFDVVATTVGYEKELEAKLGLEAIIIGKLVLEAPEGEKKEVHLGETKQLKATVLDDRGNPIPGAKVRWRASGWALTVTETGEIEGRAIGNATIVAEAGPSKASIEYEVLDWPAGKAPR